MKSPIIIFTILALSIFSLSDSLASSKQEVNSRLEVKNYSSYTASISGLTYVRVFQDGIWWIYVYDGSKLIDVFPE